MRSRRADMMKLALLALLVVYLSDVNGECIRHGVQCLEYSVLQTHEGYEERAYSPIVWVSASAEAKRKMDVSRSLMKLLYAYLGGANDRKERLSMMIPVRTTKLVLDADRNHYTMALPLLPEQSENPPAPSNPSVKVTREPTTLYVARSFGGHARPDHMWDNNARILREAVANDESVDTSFYFMAAYDSPWNTTDRLNEVWMVKTE